MESPMAISVPHTAICTVSIVASCRSARCPRSGGNMRLKKSAMNGAPRASATGLSPICRAVNHSTPAASRPQRSARVALRAALRLFGENRRDRAHAAFSSR